MASVFKAKHFRLFSTISYFMPETIFLRELFGFKRGKRDDCLEECVQRRMCLPWAACQTYVDSDGAQGKLSSHVVAQRS